MLQQTTALKTTFTQVFNNTASSPNRHKYSTSHVRCTCDPSIQPQHHYQTSYQAYRQDSDTPLLFPLMPWISPWPGNVMPVVSENLQHHFVLGYNKRFLPASVRNGCVEDWTVKSTAFSSDRCGMSSGTREDKMSRFKGSVFHYWILKQYRCTSTSLGV